MKLRSIDERLTHLSQEMRIDIDPHKTRLLMAYELKYSRGKAGFALQLLQFRAFGLYYGITTNRFLTTAEIARVLGISTVAAAKFRVRVKIYFSRIFEKRIPRKSR